MVKIAVLPLNCAPGAGDHRPTLQRGPGAWLHLTEPTRPNKPDTGVGAPAWRAKYVQAQPSKTKQIQIKLLGFIRPNRDFSGAYGGFKLDFFSSSGAWTAFAAGSPSGALGWSASIPSFLRCSRAAARMTSSTPRLAATRLILSSSFLRASAS